MRTWLFPLFLLYPVLELAVLIKVGGVIGVLPTLALIILTGVLGVFLLRIAGVATSLRVREQLARGEPPQRELMQGMLTALGGLLLILPGFIGDLVGLLCLLPLTRDRVLDYLRRNAEEQVLRRRAFAEDARVDGGEARRPEVIEGEYQEKDAKK